jgi:hypothetical protein
MWVTVMEDDADAMMKEGKNWVPPCHTHTVIGTCSLLVTHNTEISLQFLLPERTYIFFDFYFHPIYLRLSP